MKILGFKQAFWTCTVSMKLKFLEGYLTYTDPNNFVVQLLFR
jgi:hypothetical protein